MKYATEVTIAAPREVVAGLFDDPSLLTEWRPNLVSFRPLEGVPGQPGSTSEVVERMGRREIRMIETIVERRMPDLFAATYEADGVWNLVENRFSEAGPDSTRWRIDTEFRCTGLVLRLMTLFAPGLFRRETLKFQNQFKDFVEAGGA